MVTEISALLEANSGGPYEKLDDNSLDVEEVKSEDAQSADRKSLCFKIIAILALGCFIYLLWRWGVWQWMWAGISSINWIFWKKNDSNDSPVVNSGANATSTDTTTTTTITPAFHGECVDAKDVMDETGANTGRTCAKSWEIVQKLLPETKVWGCPKTLAAQCPITCGKCDPQGSCPSQNHNAHLSRVMNALFHLESVVEKAPDDFTSLPKTCDEAEKFCNATSTVLATVTSQRCRSTCELCDATDLAIATSIGGTALCQDDTALLQFFLIRAKTTHDIDGIKNCSEAKHLCTADTQYLSQGVQAACKKTCGTCDSILQKSQKGPNKNQFCTSKETDGCYFGSNAGCCEGETCVPPAFSKGQTGYLEMKTRAKVQSYCELSQTLLDLDVTLSPHCYCLKAE